jgi:hypothetical protein
MYINRLIDKYLMDWANAKSRKPLLLRGARQVGKSSSVRHLAENFDNFVEINTEQVNNVPHSRDVYAIFHQSQMDEPLRGICSENGGNDVRLSSIPKRLANAKEREKIQKQINRLTAKIKNEPQENKRHEMARQRAGLQKHIQKNGEEYDI